MKEGSPISARLGLVGWRVPAWGPEMVELAATVGAAGVQLDLGGPGRGDWLDGPGVLADVRARARDTGIVLAGLAVNHMNDVGLTRPAAAPLLHRHADAAAELGVPLVFVPSFRASAINCRDDLLRTADALRGACALAEPRGLLVASENTLPPEHARQLAERVASPAFRLLLDTGNPAAANVDLAGLLAGAGQLFADQVHVKRHPDTAPLAEDPGLGALLDDVARHLPAVSWWVLENDYRDGDLDRLSADLRVLGARTTEPIGAS